MSVTRIDQDMAALAARTLAESGTVDRELRTRYRQLRVMLHSAGLAATYAYIASKAKAGADGDKLGKAYAAAERALLRRIFAAAAAPRTARDALAALGAMNAADYARASAEASAFVGWLSRLADADWQASGGDGQEPGGDGQEAGGDGDA